MCTARIHWCRRRARAQPSIVQPSSGMRPMLQIEHLSKTYSNGVEALKDVSLTIQTGMLGLLGPNGAGKSTLMRTLATLQEPDSGRIALNDIDARKQPDALRRCLGYLPQEFGVY